MQTPIVVQKGETGMTEPQGHRWSGWPGAFCLDCGMEDADELDLAGPPDQVQHRYSDTPHNAQPCEGCGSGPCRWPGSRRFDPYQPAADVIG